MQEQNQRDRPQHYRRRNHESCIDRSRRAISNPGRCGQSNPLGTMATTEMSTPAHPRSRTHPLDVVPQERNTHLQLFLQLEPAGRRAQGCGCSSSLPTWTSAYLTSRPHGLTIARLELHRRDALGPLKFVRSAAPDCRGHGIVDQLLQRFHVRDLQLRCPGSERVSGWRVHGAGVEGELQ